MASIISEFDLWIEKIRNSSCDPCLCLGRKFPAAYLEQASAIMFDVESPAKIQKLIQALSENTNIKTIICYFNDIDQHFLIMDAMSQHVINYRMCIESVNLDKYTQVVKYLEDKNTTLLDFEVFAYYKYIDDKILQTLTNRVGECIDRNLAYRIIFETDRDSTKIEDLDYAEEDLTLSDTKPEHSLAKQKSSFPLAKTDMLLQVPAFDLSILKLADFESRIPHAVVISKIHQEDFISSKSKALTARTPELEQAVDIDPKQQRQTSLPSRAHIREARIDVRDTVRTDAAPTGNLILYQMFGKEKTEQALLQNVRTHLRTKEDHLAALPSSSTSSSSAAKKDRQSKKLNGKKDKDPARKRKCIIM